MVNPAEPKVQNEIYKTSSPDAVEEAKDCVPLGKSLSRMQDKDHIHSVNYAVDNTSTTRPDMHISIPSTPGATDVALAAVQYLPTPVIILSSLKTILIANEAMGRLLDLYETGNEANEHYRTVSEILRGQSLSQVGIDLISDGLPVWVSWERFLDNLATGVNVDSEKNEASSALSSITTSENTPTDHRFQPQYQEDTAKRFLPKSNIVHDTVVDVVVSTVHASYHSYPSAHLKGYRSARSPGQHIACRMIISIWKLEGQQFFTLSFISSLPATNKAHPHSHGVPKTAALNPALSRSSSSVASSKPSSAVTSPSEVSLSTSAFPPSAAPSKVESPSPYEDFQKITRMKDAMLAAMDIPVLAMYKDESVVIPNRAMRKLLSVDIDPLSGESHDFMSRFKPWTPDFQRELEEEENPIITLIRTEQGFSRWQIGIDQNGKRSIYDVEGQPVHDEKTGEFFAGLVAFKDVTDYTEKIATQNAENEQQFSLICDTMPQMIWTTRPDGYHDYFSQRWYDYTGLTPKNSLGLGWKLPFHDEDMVESVKRWKHSLATGEEYLTEYRCQKWDGEWRWMLGRALPLRDQKSGKIVKWFGTCTDIQDVVDARITSRRSREQLLSVLRHAEMTMWTCDPNSKVTFFEGDLKTGVDPEKFKTSILGRDIYSVFAEVGISAKTVMKLKAILQRILKGESTFEIYENTVDATGKSYRSRIVPQYAQKGADGQVDENIIEGAIGISMDVTSVKDREQENIRLLAQEHAARESSKMKSSFLANMSHEIRTPIAGVMGMSELLIDTNLDAEQLDFAQNIHRSATSLLTVINDILDFSKIESGKLMIEEVQFSIGTVLGDVSKMLSFAAERKNLRFISDISIGKDSNHDLIVIGDPGRLRQILTNLLTNSIKFTSNGFVKLKVRVIEETDSTATVQFCVEDTGIGIEEEVKKLLFRPFSQADGSTARRFGGTGLGLTISKNLVDLMHGTISLESTLDVGTTAHFQIPFKKPEFTTSSPASLAEMGVMPDRLHSEFSMSANTSSRGDSGTHSIASPVPQSPHAMISAGGLAQRSSSANLAAAPTSSPTYANLSRDKFHVLVVEDNVVNSQFALKTLHTLGFPATAVWNGQAALEYLLKAAEYTERGTSEATQHPMPNLILMDVQMPVLDGYRATHTIRRHQPFKSNNIIQKIPIVAMTASAIQGDKEKCERAGMDDYMAKPVKRATLEKMLLQWLQGEKRLTISSGAADNGDSSDGGRPDLSRHGTDRSSNCPGSEEPLNHAVHLHDVAPISSTLPASTSAALRSSISKSLLAAERPSGETEGERGMRRANAEEQASSLRDAKLLASIRDDCDHETPDLRPVDFRSIEAEQPGSTMLAQAGAQSSVLALTEANMEKFNADRPDHASTDQLSEDMFNEDQSWSHDSLLQNAPVATRLTSSLLTAGGTPSEVDDIGSLAERGKSRQSLPTTLDRQRSDWSTSTAKP